MNDVNNRWRQNFLTNRHEAIPILFRRNLNRQIADKQADQKEKGEGEKESQKRMGKIGGRRSRFEYGWSPHIENSSFYVISAEDEKSVALEKCSN